METAFAVLKYILLSILDLLVQPFGFFWVAVLLVGIQIFRQLEQRAYILKGKEVQIWRPLFLLTLFGLLGGFLGSILLVLVGISFDELGIGYLWLVAILLMLVHPRFLCFSYSAGILSVSFLLFNWPQINISQLMGLVAILHLVESFLIFVSGHLTKIPLWTKNDHGQVVGGFMLQQFWPIPLALLTIIAIPEVGDFGVEMPNWWPLIPLNKELTEGVGFALMPVVAALGYGDLALTKHPRKKAKETAYFLAIYSVCLLFLSILSAYWSSLLLLTALFGPLAHEAVIKKGQAKELKGKPVFVHDDRGLLILDVERGSPGFKAGLRSGDLLLKVNGWPLYTRNQLESYMESGERRLEIDFVSMANGAYRREFIYLPWDQELGVLFAPEAHDKPLMELRREGWLQGILKKFKKN